MAVCGLDLSGLGCGPVADAYEHGNEPSVSIKREKFLNQLNVLLACKEGTYTMDLVGWLVGQFVGLFQDSLACETPAYEVQIS